MSHRCLAFSIVIALAGCGGAGKPAGPTSDPKQPGGAGSYAALVEPGAKWVLTNRNDPEAPSETDTITIEVTGVHAVGGATVATLTWVSALDGGSMEGRDHLPELIAVTPAGMWMFAPGTDDASIGKALANPPDLADPPVAIEPSEAGRWQYVFISKPVPVANQRMICWGHAAPNDDCEDTCTGEVCVMPGKGVISIDGTASPNFEYYVLRGMNL